MRRTRMEEIRAAVFRRRTRAWTGEWTGWKTPAGEYFGVRKLSENHSAPELEIATEWFRELNNRVPKPH
jgi:hypothetical protein